MRVGPFTPRLIASVMALLLVVGGVVLLVNRGAGTPPADLPAHVATSLSALPGSSQAAAAHVVDLNIATPGNVLHVAALVLPNDLAVTTTYIPVNAMITGSTATHTNFPVTLEGRDNVMGFSIVQLGVPIKALKLDAMPSSTIVTIVAPVTDSSSQRPQFDWTESTLGDPTLNAQGVVRYLATKSSTAMSSFVDAIAIDQAGNVVAVLSSRHFWYAARFVAEVAKVVATGHGCHADFGVSGVTEQGGGVLVKRVVRYSAAAHAGVKVGDVITTWNGADLDSWNQLASTLYLTPAYSKATLTFDESTTVHHQTVTLGCPFMLVP